MLEPWREGLLEDASVYQSAEEFGSSIAQSKASPPYQAGIWCRWLCLGCRARVA